MQGGVVLGGGGVTEEGRDRRTSSADNGALG